MFAIDYLLATPVETARPRRTPDGLILWHDAINRGVTSRDTRGRKDARRGVENQKI